MAYLMKTKQLHLKEAFNDIKQRRHVISPSFGFLDQFLQQESKILSSTPTCRLHTAHMQTLSPGREFSPWSENGLVVNHGEIGRINENEEDINKNQNTSGNNSIRNRVVQNSKHVNAKQGEEQVTIEQDSLRSEEDEEDDQVMHPNGCLARKYDAVCDFRRKHRTTIRYIIWGILLAGYLAMVIAACVLNFHRALPLFVITVVAIFFVIWDHFMAKYEHQIDEFLSPGRRLLDSHWFWLKWVIWSSLILGVIFWLIFDTAKLGQQQLVSFGGLIVYIILLFLFSKYPTKTFLEFTNAGASFVFGEKYTDHFFAFKILPIVIFFSTVMSMLYYLGLMQWIVRKVGWIMLVTMGSSPIESVVAAGNIFVGQSESPLLVRPYLPYITKSELHAIMTAGYATIAGSVLGAYISFGLICSYIFMPFSFMMGVDWQDSFMVAKLLGYKTFFNEFVAYEHLSKLINLRKEAGPKFVNGVQQYMSIRSEIIATYALCGFANISSLGIVIGALISMAPSRKDDIISGAMRALISGTTACFMTACVAGILSGTPVDVNCHHILEKVFNSSLPRNTTSVVSCCQTLLSSTIVKRSPTVLVNITVLRWTTLTAHMELPENVPGIMRHNRGEHQFSPW
ncbi:Solute carrier family 28 member 3 [Myotis brandtii]|uniref:Solute carrier family 28 member 3 n=1 Tax=Myotis brandtii TaxID=109478 RepID=S7MWK8_MYOBR|nr:Solute carrier family 28 member 3 [Myotis brandtii]